MKYIYLPFVRLGLAILITMAALAEIYLWMLYGEKHRPDLVKKVEKLWQKVNENP